MAARLGGYLECQGSASRLAPGSAKRIAGSRWSGTRRWRPTGAAHRVGQANL